MTLDEFYSFPSMLSVRNYDQLVHCVKGMGYARLDGVDGKFIDNQILYSCNKLGFRSNEILTSVDHCYYGCSVTYGLGVDVEDRWTNLVDQSLLTTSNNFAVSGASVADIAGLFVATSNFVTTKRAYMVLPDLMRQTMPIPIAHDDIRYRPLRQSLSPEIAKIWQIYYSLPNPFYIDQYRNLISLIQLIAELREIDLKIYTWVPEDLDFLRSVIPSAELFDRSYDLGADNSHPGPITHKTFAQSIINKESQP